VRVNVPNINPSTRRSGTRIGGWVVVSVIKCMLAHSSPTSSEEAAWPVAPVSLALAHVGISYLSSKRSLTSGSDGGARECTTGRKGGCAREMLGCRRQVALRRLPSGRRHGAPYWQRRERRRNRKQKAVEEDPAGEQCQGCEGCVKGRPVH